MLRFGKKERKRKERRGVTYNYLDQGGAESNASFAEDIYSEMWT